jgi:hypothetical protein
MLRPLTLLPLAALAACVPDNEFAVIKIVSRPTVGDGAEMAVEVARDGFSETLYTAVASGDRTFTASIPRDTTWVVATLLDRDGAEVAGGEGPPRSHIVLDPAAFTVNVTGDATFFAGEAATGRQLAGLDDGSFAVAWQDAATDTHVRARAFTADGAPAGVGERGVDGEVRLTPVDAQSLDRSQGAALVGVGDHYLLSHELDASAAGIRGEVLVLDRDLAVTAVLPPAGLRTESGASQLSAVRLPTGGLAVAWVESQSDATGPRHVTFLSPAGAAINDVVLPGTGMRPQLVAWGDRVAVVGGRDDGVGTLDVVTLDQVGGLVGDPLTVAVSFDPYATPVRAVAVADALVLVWLSVAEATTLRAVRIGADRVPEKPVDAITLDGLDGLAVAAAPGGELALAWAETRGGASGTGKVLWTVLGADLAPRFAPRRVTTAVEPQRTPSIAAVADGFAIAWSQLAPVTATRASVIRGRIVYPPASP